MEGDEKGRCVDSMAGRIPFLPGRKSRFKGPAVGVWLCVLETELEGRS